MAGAAFDGVPDADKKLRNDVIAALWTNNPPPVDYVELLLCRDVFHCRPSELAQEDIGDVLRMLACIDAEEFVKRRRAENDKRRRKR